MNARESTTIDSPTTCYRSLISQTLVCWPGGSSQIDHVCARSPAKIPLPLVWPCRTPLWLRSCSPGLKLAPLAPHFQTRASNGSTIVPKGRLMKVTVQSGVLRSSFYTLQSEINGNELGYYERRSTNRTLVYFEWRHGDSFPIPPNARTCCRRARIRKNVRRPFCGPWRTFVECVFVLWASNRQ